MAFDADELLSRGMRMPALKSRRTTQTVGGDQFMSERNNLAFDVKTTTLSDVQWMLRSIAFQEIGNQADAGNVVSRVIVDGRDSKNIVTAQRKVEALFGVKMERKAMRLVEQILQIAIDRTTVKKSGDLRNTVANWEWVFAARYDMPGVKVTNDILVSMPPGSCLILRPKLDYAGVANVRSHAGQYLKLAEKMMRRKRPFSNFRIAVGVSRKFKVEGEQSWLGTPFIRLSVKGRI